MGDKIEQDLAKMVHKMTLNEDEDELIMVTSEETYKDNEVPEYHCNLKINK